MSSQIRLFLFVFLFQIWLYGFLSYHLTNHQMTTIHRLIKDDKLNSRERDQINKILYRSYEKFAVAKAYEFKNTHVFKCKHIDKDELVLSSKVGLYKAIQRYNGNHSLTGFSEIYIKGELLKTLTSHFSMSILPKRLRMKNKKNFTKEEMIRYKNNFQPQWMDTFDMDGFSSNQPTTVDKIIEKEEEDRYYREVWDRIYQLKPFTKRILFLKYDYYFHPIRSNKDIGELMCVSEEMVRKTLIIFNKINHWITIN